MQRGLYWVQVASGKARPFATIGMCEDGKTLTPINPDHRHLRVSGVGGYIGDLEDAVRELTGNTPRYVRPAPRRKIEQSEQVYYGA